MPYGLNLLRHTLSCETLIGRLVSKNCATNCKWDSMTMLLSSAENILHKSGSNQKNKFLAGHTKSIAFSWVLISIEMLLKVSFYWQTWPLDANAHNCRAQHSVISLTWGYMLQININRTLSKNAWNGLFRFDGVVLNIVNGYHCITH